MKLYLVCSECSSEVNADLRGEELRIEPCVSCILTTVAEAEEKAREQGYDEGYRDGERNAS